MLTLLDSSGNILQTLRLVQRNEASRSYNLEAVPSPYSDIFTPVGDRKPRPAALEFVAIVEASTAQERSSLISQLNEDARDTRKLLFLGATRDVAGLTEMIVSPLGHQASRVVLRFAPVGPYWTRDGVDLELI